MSVFPSGDKEIFFIKNFHQKHKVKCIFEGKEDRYQQQVEKTKIFPPRKIKS